jgi:YD repeat-containing protein
MLYRETSRPRWPHRHLDHTNGLNQTRTVAKDSDGQTVSVTDAAGKTTSFAYDPFGKMIRTTDAKPKPLR